MLETPYQSKHQSPFFSLMRIKILNIFQNIPHLPCFLKKINPVTDHIHFRYVTNKCRSELSKCTLHQPSSYCGRIHGIAHLRTILRIMKIYEILYNIRINEHMFPQGSKK